MTIKTKPVTKEYEEGFDRIFRSKPEKSTMKIPEELGFKHGQYQFSPADLEAVVRYCVDIVMTYEDPGCTCKVCWSLRPAKTAILKEFGLK